MSRRFRFKLQVLLEVRGAEKDRWRRIVAQRVRTIDGLQDEERRLQSLAAEALRDAVMSSSERRLDVARLARQRCWSAHVQRRALACGLQIDQQQRDLAVERDALARASTNVQAIEKLRERLAARQQAELKRAERREADEALRTLDPASSAGRASS